MKQWDLGELHNYHAAALIHHLHTSLSEDAWLAETFCAAGATLTTDQLAQYQRDLAPRMHTQRADRQFAYQALRLSSTATALSETLFEDSFTTSDLRAWRAALAQATLSPNERWLLQQAARIFESSYAFWGMHQAAWATPTPPDSTQPDPEADRKAFRKLRRRRIAKADTYGLFKGLIAGAWWFGGDNLLWNVSDDLAVGGAVALIVAVPVVESLFYVRKLKRDPGRIFDDPWWGPDLPRPTF